MSKTNERNGMFTTQIGILGMFAFVATAMAVGATENTLAGNYVLDRAKSGSVPAAVDTCVSHLNVFKRGIARYRLEKTNVPPEKISISLKESAIEITQGSDPVASCAKDGKPSHWTDRSGETFQLTCQREGNRLVQIFKGEDGQSKNEYSLNADGTELWLKVMVSSPELPQPLTYRLAYHRR